jgi:glyceraldehyde-3-phosphate dehydrogenase/erythrose-4-phosphate dehydrogenase
MSKVKLGINGFGRIEELFSENLYNRDNVEVVVMIYLMWIIWLTY